jgi:ribosome-binding protein aMBF1 (putative translation factor)
MDGQDWTPVTLRSSKSTTAARNPASNLSDSAQYTRKIDNSDVITKMKVLTTESRQAMASARVAKKLTQKQLDGLGQFAANSCNGWESGKSCPTGPQLNKLHRLLGVKLTAN